MMSHPVMIPSSMVDHKPPHGAPCNGCGVCCVASLCQLARAVFDRPELPGPCPALRPIGDGGFKCGIVSALEDKPVLAASARLLIGAGYGCDARINGEPIDHAFKRRLEQWDIANAADIAAARTIWGVR